MEREEAIEIVKKNWPDQSYSILRDALETLVPELVESEDVKMRKSIISTLQFAAAHHLIDSNSATKMEDWLKKQENNNTNIDYGYSEKDKKMIDLLIAIIEVNHPNGMFKVNPEFTTDMKTVSSREIISWLRSFSTRQTKETPTKEESNIINGWVVRDNNANRLWFCDKLPSRGKSVWTASPGSEWFRLNSKLLPTLSWSDEPMEVELNIKKK